MEGTAPRGLVGDSDGCDCKFGDSALRPVKEKTWKNI